MPRLACVPPVPRAFLEPEPEPELDARAAPAVFAIDFAAPLPPDAARFDVAVPPALFDAGFVTPARCCAPLDFDAPRDTDSLRSAAPVSVRSDAPPRPAAAFVVVDREPPAALPDVAPRVARVDFAVPDFLPPAPFDAVFDAPPRLAEVFKADVFDAPVDFVAPLAFEALARPPLPADAARFDPAPSVAVRSEAERDDADDFFTAVPRDALCSSSPRASRALFERPACFLIVVPACAAPGPVRPPAVVAMGMLRSNVAPAGARSS